MIELILKDRNNTTVRVDVNELDDGRKWLTINFGEDSGYICLDFDSETVSIVALTASGDVIMEDEVVYEDLKPTTGELE